MLSNPGRASQERDRGRKDSRFRNAIEARPKDVYYRPEYGWVMSNAQVEEEKKVKGQYDAAIADARTKVAQYDQDYQNSLAAGRGQINAAYASAAAKNNVPMVPVRVVNGNTVEATYMLPKSTVEDMNVNSFNKGKGSYVGNYVDGGKYYNVDVRTTGAGVNGQPLHDALRNAASNDAAARAAANSALGKEKAASLAGFESASAESYAGAKQTWESELSRLESAYGERVAKGKAQYEDSKQKYSDSVTGVDLGLLESPTGKVNPNSKEGKNGNEKV